MASDLLSSGRPGFAGTHLAFELDATRAEAAMRAYPARTNRAVTRALNRALTSGHVVVSRLVSKDLRVPVGEIKKRIRIRKASASDLSIRLAASLARVPLIHFAAKQTRRGVTYRLSGGRGRIEEAFIATMPTGHTGVYVRGNKRGPANRRGPKPMRAQLPISEKAGPSFGRVFDKHRDALLAAIRASFDTNLTHELRFAQREGGDA